MEEPASELKLQYLIGNFSEKTPTQQYPSPLSGRNQVPISHRRSETCSETPFSVKCTNNSGLNRLVKFCYSTTLIK